MAFHIVGRPNDTSKGESFPRDELLSLSKFLAEAKPSQRKIILGWLVDTRTFVVKLQGRSHVAGRNRETTCTAAVGVRSRPRTWPCFWDA
jgi:hypothetical protein